MPKPYVYPDSTPVDEPTSPEPKRAPKISKAKPVKYKGDVPVDEPTGYAKGGSIDGCAQRGKTRGKYI